MLFMFNIQIRTLKLQQKKPAKLHACVCVLGRGSGQKKMFLYRGLSPGCYALCVRVVNFKSTKRKRKKKKRKKSQRNGSQLLRPIVITRPEMVIKCIRFPSGVIRLQFILCYLPLRFVWRHVEEQIKAEVANSRQVQHSCIPIEWHEVGGGKTQRCCHLVDNIIICPMTTRVFKTKIFFSWKWNGKTVKLDNFLKHAWKRMDGWMDKKNHVVSPSRH